MKKLFITVLFLCCCIGLLFVFFQNRNVQQTASASDFLPENVLLYAEQQDFSEIFKEFQDSKLGRILQDMQFLNVLQELGAPLDQVNEVRTAVEQIHAFIKGPAFNELLGREFSVALFPAKSFSADNPALALEERLLLISRPRHNAQFLQFLAPMLTEDIAKSSVQYGKYTIDRYQMDDSLTVSAVVVKDLVLIAVDERLIRKGLDVYDKKQNTLSQNEEYKQFRKRMEKAKLFTYLSFPALYEQGKIISEKLPEKEEKEFMTLLEQWKGWGGAVYGAWKEDTLLQEKVIINYDKKQLDSRIVELLSVKPSKNDTLAMVSSDVLFYYWTNTLNLPLLWDVYSSALVRQSGDLDLLHQEILDATGVEFEEILDMVSKDIGVLVQDIESKGIPLPKAALILKLKKPKAFENVFKKLLATADIPISEEKYKNSDISYWGVAPQSGLQPAFTFIGGYAYISNSIDVIKQIIGLLENSEGNFMDDKKVQMVTEHLTLPNNSAAYINIAGLAAAFREFAVWASSMASLQGPEVANSSKIAVDKIILPLLEGIAMYSQLGSRSVFEDNAIILESTISIEQ